MGALAREGRKCDNRVVVIYTKVNQSDIPRAQTNLPDLHRYHVYISFLGCHLMSCYHQLHSTPKYTSLGANRICFCQTETRGKKWSDAHPPINIIGRFFIFSSLPIPACFAFFLLTAAPIISSSRWSCSETSLSLGEALRASVSNWSIASIAA